MQNTPTLWLPHFPFPTRDTHKYNRGHALIYGGEIMTGAARLAARAAQRIGAGLVTIAASKKSAPIYAAALESVIVHEINDTTEWRSELANPKHTTLLIGPGLGQGTRQIDLILAALDTKKPCVLDADALTNPEILFPKLHTDCVLTPHEGEFKRLFNDTIDPTLPKPTRAIEAAKRANCTFLLKGAETIIAAPDGKTIANNNAPPWLATAGSGDVLAGIVLGLITQSMPIFLATAAAAWLHGNIATTFGPGLIAEDLIDGIPNSVKKLFEQQQHLRP